MKKGSQRRYLKRLINIYFFVLENGRKIFDTTKKSLSYSPSMLWLTQCLPIILLIFISLQVSLSSVNKKPLFVKNHIARMVRMILVKTAVACGHLEKKKTENEK